MCEKQNVGGEIHGMYNTGYYQYQDTEFVFDMLVHPYCSA